MFKLKKGDVMNEWDLKEIWDFANEYDEDVKFVKDVEEGIELYLDEESELNFN